MLLNVLRELLIRKKVQQWPLFNILLSKLDFLGNEASHENFYSIFVLYFVVETLRTQLYRKLRITLYMWKKKTAISSSIVEIFRPFRQTAHLLYQWHN